MITVITPAESIDLTTVATVRAELGIVDSSEDARLSSLIHMASGVIAEHCDRVFGFETVAERIRLHRFHESELILTRYPVVTITSIVEDSVTLTASDYELDKAKGIVTRVRNSMPTVWSTMPIVVTYSAGYELIDDLPWGVERAAIGLVKSYYAGRDPSIRTESVDGISTTGYFNGEALPPEVAGLLKSYRNYRPR